LVTARGEVVDESDVPMTEEPETSTPLPTKKGKSLRTKTSNKSSSKTPVLKEVSPAGPSTPTVAQPAASAGTQSPPVRIETYKAAKKVLADCGKPATPEPQSTIEQDLREISSTYGTEKK
jgi:hypothetical protein